MLPFHSPSRKPGWLSILFQEGKLTLAHVVRRPGSRPEVVSLESFVVEKGEREALQRLRSARRLNGFRCTTLMGEGESNLTQLDAPPVPKEERKEALRWALRDVVNYPVESACIDVLDVPGDNIPGRAAGVLAVSAAERSVRARAAPFEEARVAIEAIDVPELAQRNVAALFEDAKRGLVFLRLDENGAMLTLTWCGELVAVRRSEMNTRQLLSDDAAQRERVRERLVLELQRSLDNFDRQYSAIPVSKVVLAAYPPVEGLAAELAANVYVPVQAMDLALVLEFSGVPELRDAACQARNLLAIGAALRDEEAGQQADLYEARLRPHRQLATARNLGVSALVVLLCVVAASVWVQRDAAQKTAVAAALQQQATEQQEKLTALTKAVAAQRVSPALAAELDAAKAALAERGEVMEALESGRHGSTAGFSAIMTGFARQARQDLWLTGFSVARGGEDIEIRGRTLDPASLPAYVQRLRGEPVFQGRRFSGLEMLDKEPDEAKAEGKAEGKAEARPAAPPRFVEFVLRSDFLPGKGLPSVDARGGSRP